MRLLFLSIVIAFVGPQVQAQTYSLQELEEIFLQKNAQLIANKYNIAKADALIVQEKLWQNPTFAISEVNLWSTYNVEKLPNLFGKYGKNQQISLELEQVIETAGKRKKRVLIKELEKQNAVLGYEELLRELKRELRVSYYSLNRIKQVETRLISFVELFRQMDAQYKRQVALQNISKVDFYRVQTELLGLEKELIELKNEEYSHLNIIRILTNLTDLEPDQIAILSTNSLNKENIPANILELAKQQNIGILLQQNEIKNAEYQWKLEKSQRVPNLAVQMNYDRGGNIMPDFVGFGVSFDLPVFNKNKGNIKAAKFSIEQETANKTVLENQLEQNIMTNISQLNRINSSLENWTLNQFEEYDNMIVNYKKHLQSSQITLMEFIDFISAYRNASQSYFELQETYNTTFEELQYIVGRDF